MGVTLREISRKNGDIAFQLDISYNGNRWNETIKGLRVHKSDLPHKKKEKKEKAYQIKLNKELELVEHGYDVIFKSKKQSDFFKLTDECIKDFKAAGKVNPRKLEGMKSKFKTFLGKDKILTSSINKKMCQGFANYLMNPKNGLSGESPNMYWIKFKGVFNRAIDERIIKTNPCNGIVVPKNVNDLGKEILSIDELRLLNNTYCGNDLVKDTFLVACFTGFGKAEIKELKWSSIDLLNKKIKNQRAKNNKLVYNSMNDSVYNIILKYKPLTINPNDKVFPPLPSDNATNKAIDNWVRRADINKHITFYCGRHSFGVMLLNKTGNIYAVKEAMAHSSINTTLKYVQYADSEKDKAIINLPTL